MRIRPLFPLRHFVSAPQARVPCGANTKGNSALRESQSHVPHILLLLSSRYKKTRWRPFRAMTVGASCFNMTAG